MSSRIISEKPRNCTKAYDNLAYCAKLCAKLCKPKGNKAKLWIAKLLAEGGKTPRRRRQNFVQNYVLQAIQSLQSEALYKLCKAFASQKVTKSCTTFTSYILQNDEYKAHKT
ncbi:hypothetical protein EON73_00695 [bacterium]|nr:MAG: hypothetical protein EON73_00695 [bacterium]